MALSPGNEAVSLKSVLLMHYSIVGDCPTRRSHFTIKLCELLARDQPHEISRRINVKLQPKPVLKCADPRDCNSLRGYTQPTADSADHGPLAESVQVRDSVSSHLEVSNIHLKNEV